MPGFNVRQSHRRAHGASADRPCPHCGGVVVREPVETKRNTRMWYTIIGIGVIVHLIPSDEPGVLGWAFMLGAMGYLVYYGWVHRQRHRLFCCRCLRTFPL